MSIDAMRYSLSKAYGPKAYKWKEKVARMSDRQVLAVYLSFVQRGLV